MDVRTLTAYQSKFLTGTDIGSTPKDYTITDAQSETVGDEPDPQLILTLAGETKRWIVNKTQLNKLTDLMGFDTGDWIGKTIRLMGQELTSGQFAGKWTILVLQLVEPEQAQADEIPF